MRSSRLTLIAASTLALAACSDGAVAPKSADISLAENRSAKPASYMSNYVAIGTSLSMGWANDGVFVASQSNAWPKQLAEQAGVDFTIPGIDAPGCQPPLAAPLIAFKRSMAVPRLLPRHARRTCLA